MKTKTKKTWFIIADASRMRTFESSGEASAIHACKQVDRPDYNKRTKDLGTDRPGRGRKSGSGGHYALEPRADWHDQAEEAFTSNICADLKDACRSKKFDELYIFAPPKMVGKFRTQLDKETENRVVKYVGRDLAHLPDADICNRLRDYLSLAEQTPVINFHRGG